MVGHGGSSAASYLADPTSLIPSHCASIVMTSTLRVNQSCLIFHPPITHHCWVSRGSMEWEACSTFLHITSSEKWIWDLLILSPMLYLFGHYTPMQWGNYYHGISRNPTAAVNLFLVGKQYLTFYKAEAAVTRNLIGRKIISNVKGSDTRNSIRTVAYVKVNYKRHTLKSQTPEHVRVLQRTC